MKDSIFWNEESDNYTLRAKKNFADLYKDYDMHVVDRCLQLLGKFAFAPTTVLDLGCAYGAFTYHLSNSIDAKFFGIDPGEETIKFASENIKKPNIHFKKGYAHELPFEDGSFDFIIINMVLQWIPRQFLFRTVAEIDRVLSSDGLIFIQEFSPDVPKYSHSAHNSDIFIFKESYSNVFTAYKWFKLKHNETFNSEDGDDYQKEIALIEKIDLARAYELKEWN